ncbi:Rap1-interacting factor 1 N terminal-domain-containing protein [Dactylonectria estremocensis]|uniref:Rap1-interacting factor 1 N terminal-domain-containing protein n=1 Tax=Dactylonectria estremocensis TaxID=1079267 RepID=A0A9P9ITY1_9HYPO|nr:Rap1-interacting factor 1 N terminal-domain-containing protein [Dactylonectria estremocensis]
MASSAPASNTVIESLPTRPPTPPRETLPESRLCLKAAVLAHSPFNRQLQLSTPPNPNSPLSNGATNSSPSKRLRKKVEWSAHTEYKEPPQYREGSKLNRSSPLSAPASVSRPIKSILKPSPSPNPLASSLHGNLDGLSSQANIAEMLDSTIKQLAGSDRDSRLDAYMMLSRALKASNNLPDRVALQDKMSLFMQFIQRDIKSRTENGSPDYSLINHALTLLTTFLHFQAIASTLTSDFGVFIIDHCIRSFDDQAVPKDLVRHLMQVVAFQSFSPKVMTLDRVGRLVTSMHRIEDRLTGKSIVMGRIQIYKRLIKQSRSHMAIHTDWMMDMFTDMMSTIRDIRAQAISLGADAGFSLRNEKPIMRKATEIFQTMDGEETYIEFYIRKLEAMVKDRTSSSTVPQIWSAVTLFLRCPLDRWQYFGPWLKLAQSAFNTTDTQTKQEANYAWNRYVYLSLIDTKTAPKALGLLAQPLISQLRRKVSTKQAEEGMKLRRIVVGGICNLYYYAFRPHDNASIDTVWDLALQPVMSQLINLDGKPETHSDSMVQASRILAGLLDVSTPRSWREDRIRDMPLVTPEDLPAIDSKWTRRNSEKAFQLVGPILEKRFTDLANKESLTYRLWQALVGSIAAASAKDIKVSDDTVRFFACAFGVLSKVWSQGYHEGEASVNSKFLPSVKNFIHVLVTSLGLLPFTEKRLSLFMSNTFEPSATPSHRPDRPRGAAQAPVYHLFSILCSAPPGVTDNEALCDFFQSVFEPFFNEKSTKIRVELTREMLRLLPRDAQAPYGPWVLAADNMRLTLEQILSSSGPPSSERLLGPEYREVVSLLERGLLSHPNLPSTAWFSLFNFLSDHIVQECGDAGRALGLVEPIAKILLENFFKGAVKPNQTALIVTTMLFKVAKLPRDRQAVEAARRRLWGAPPTISRASTFDPFDNLYKLQEQSMQFLYNDLVNSDDQVSIASFIEAIDSFLTASFPQTGVKTLSKLQDGLVPWIQDDKAQLKLSDGSLVSSALRFIWDSVNVHLISLGHLENKDLNLIEPLISAGFKSKHRYMVNKMAETWNFMFKDENSLECSDSLKAIITALRPQVDVSFPGIEESSGEFGAQVQSFIGSQDELSFIALSSTKSSRPEAEQATPPGPSLTKGGFKGPMTRKRRREATPDVALTKSAKRKAKSRLRHDNSQIQFAPIAPSSPLAEESQHLTERQKEVRQRQQENAGVVPGVRSSPRTRSRTSLEGKPKETPVNSRTRHQDTTPERPASYEEFISSTPTPRRGQALQMEDYNDPPSSPPEPRPNPLLSEIQTRSRGRSSLVNWEFSSPPGTPPTSHQKAARESQTSQVDSEETSTRRRSRRKTRSSTQFDPQVIPSSVPAEKASPVPAQAPKPTVPVKVKSEPREMALEVPLTPSRRAVSPDSKGQDTPKSADDEYVDARSSPEDPPREEAPVLPSELADSQEHDSSFELSEVDESSMMRLVVELEARHCNLPFDKFHSTSLEKKKASQPTTGCITVHDDPSASASPEKTTKTRSVSPMIPSTPAHPESEASQSQTQSQPQSKRKRRRSALYAETRSKRKRSVGATPYIQPEESQSKPSENTSPAPATRRSSRRNAGMKSKKFQDNEVQSPVVKQPEQADPKEVAQADRVDGRDSGDTDEELMSQLVTESNAASQSQQHEVELEPGLSIPNDPMELDEAKDEKLEKPRVELQESSGAPSSGEAGTGSNKTSTIINLLRGGLNELREAALSRDEVYQLEDMLMDMKRELFQAERRGR